MWALPITSCESVLHNSKGFLQEELQKSPLHNGGTCMFDTKIPQTVLPEHVSLLFIADTLNVGELQVAATCASEETQCLYETIQLC